jgi:hypothetical protein
MRFQPKSEAALQEERDKKLGVWATGTYDFEVAHAVDTTSKASGNDMITLDLHVYNTEGDRKALQDYLVASMEWKLRHCAYACGLGNKYETGELSATDFIGCAGRLRLGVEKSAGYPDKNKVTDYEKAKTHTVSAPRPSPRVKLPSGDIDDDIPF